MPLKGWRVFAGEVGTIVLGVLIALGAQELVQSWHWKREVSETRKALDAELSRNMAAFQYRVDQIPCISERVNEIGTWAESAGTQKPLKLKRWISRPPAFAMRTEVWDVIDGGIVSRIPLEARLNYAGLYSAVRNFDRLDAREIEAWNLLTEYQGSKRLGEEDTRRIVGALHEISGANNVLPNFATTMNRQARDLFIAPDPNMLRTANPRLLRQQKEACQPYL
jgi:hypothetical protein